MVHGLRGELLGIEIELAVEPFFMPLQDVGAILSGRVRGLFSRVIPRRAKNHHIVPGTTSVL